MAGFMAGFGTKFSELIEEDRKYYRDRAAKRQEYLQTYGTRAVADREGKANAALGVANYLITNGISKEDVRYVVDTSGVQGLAQLKATIDSRTDLTADEKSSLVKKAKDYVAENPDEDLNTVVKRAYGLYKSSDNPVKRERSLFGSILGLDSRMMEDEVMDDLYINGYTGRDIYRIMGSAGPAPGAPLDLDLPSKPPSPTVLNNTAKFLESQFETSIDSRIASIEQQMLKADPKTPQYSTLADERTKLENMKAKGLLALGQYATEYDPELFNFARAQEEALPGAITRNSYLFEFLPAYNTFFDEAEDEARVAAVDSTSDALGTTSEPTVTTTTVTHPEAKVTAPTATDIFTYETDEELNAAVESGKVIPGVTPVKKGQDGTIMMVPKASAEVTKPKTTDLGDMTGAPGFREERSSLIAETSSALQKGQATRAFIADAIPEAEDVMSVTANATAAGIDALMGTSDFIAGLTGLDTFEGVVSGKTLPEKAESGRNLAQSMREHAEEVFTMGFSEYMRSLTDKEVPAAVVAEVKENLDTDKVIRAVGTVGFQDLGLRDDVREDISVEIPKRSEWTVDSWPTENGKNITDDDVLFDILVYDRQNIAYPDGVYLGEGFTQEQIDRVKKEVDAAFDGVDLEVAELANVATRASDTPAYKQLQELLLERVALANKPAKEKKKKEVTIKKKAEKILTDLGDMSGAPGFRTEEASLLSLILADELPERVVELVENNPRAVGTVGFRDLGLRDTTDDVRPPRGDAPERSASLARPASPEADQQEFDSPRNMAAENITTRGKKARPSGLMSPPSSGTAPKLGQAQFGDLIDRVHGSSKAAAAFNKKVSSGKVTAADVTRLIKATRKLPKTTSRGMLLDSLFDLRDALNKR